MSTLAGKATNLLLWLFYRDINAARTPTQKARNQKLLILIFDARLRFAHSIFGKLKWIINWPLYTIGLR